MQNIEVLNCGIPGKAMPFFNRKAYKDPAICWDTVFDDYEKEDMAKVVYVKHVSTKDFAHKTFLRTFVLQTLSSLMAMSVKDFSTSKSF